jgi:S1-C subfamily serine protease
MKQLMFVAIIAMELASRLNAQPTGNIVSRVFQIRYGGLTGTAFVIDYEDRQYFVTADHMVEGAGQKSAVEIFGSGDSHWHSLDFTILHGGSKCVDVAVLVPAEKKFVNADPIPYPYNPAMGQEVFFLGFPYGLFTTFENQAVAIPFIKHAYLSANVSCSALYPNGTKDDGLILLDGLNNPGFSGGPVVAPDMFSPFTTVRAQKIIGVISAYRNDNIPLNVNGQRVDNASVAENSGIAIPFVRVTELIKKYLRDAEHN